MRKRPAYIFDVDGTLADVSSILHYVKGDRTTEKFKKNFHKFHAESVNVPPHKEVVEMVWEAVDAGFDIIVVTARKEMWRAQTSIWLAIHGIPSDALFMRQDADNRKDYEVKKDILGHIEQFWDVAHAVDDNPNVIKLWQEHGIETTKIGDWDGTY